MRKPAMPFHRFCCYVLVCVLCLLLPPALWGQQIHYTNFTVNEGLASNKIYNIIEDQYGFIWISTDHGVSRYDGVAFTNFTTKNGLPDNEVLGLFEDETGRIWFNSFSTEPCYYFRGKIYNALNDSFLLRVKRHKLPGPCMNFIVQSNNSMAFLIEDKGRKLIAGKDIEDIPVKYTGELQGNLIQHILIQTRDHWYSIAGQYQRCWRNNDSIRDLRMSVPVPLSMHYTRSPGPILHGLHVASQQVWIFDPVTKKKRQFNIHGQYTNFFSTRNLHILNDDKNYIIYDSAFSTVLEKVNLPFAIQRVYMDRLGNKWFGSFDHGIYFIRRGAPSRINLPDTISNGILGVSAVNDMLVLRTEKNGLIGIDKKGVCRQLFKAKAICRITGFASMHNYHLAGTDEGIFYLQQDFTNPYSIYKGSVKDMESGKRSELLLGTSNNAMIYTPGKKNRFQNIDEERTTALCRVNDSVIWLGGLKGIRENMFRDGSFNTKPLPLHEALDESRVTDIKKDPLGNIWVSTDQRGLFFCPVKGDVIRFCEGNVRPTQLISDLCLQIHIHTDSNIWVSAVGGLSVISYTGKNGQLKFDVNNYTLQDGMPDKIINQVAFRNNDVLIACPNGLFSFAAFPGYSDITGETVITQIKANERVYDYGDITLPYSQNNLIISYISSFVNTGMSYLFHYRVKELGSGWIETNNLQVPLLGLKPGDYTFEIKSVNGHGDSGKITTLRFHISTPWFRQWWFIAFLCLLFSGIALYLLQREKKRIELSRNLARMELKVLRAQMNPHFIFNSLNAIQRFLLKRDFIVVNQYISSFAKLIRSSLHYSSIEMIALKEEEIFLKNYLNIEKFRFQDLFEYEILIDVDHEVYDTEIPTFMIQPLVENCIRHAFKKMQTGGLIQIRFSETGYDYMQVDVLDNGTGLPEGFVIRDSAQPGDSIGLSIVQQRVKLLQTKFKSGPTCFHISNRTDGPGTHAMLILPVNKL